MSLKNITIGQQFNKTVDVNKEKVVMTCHGKHYTWCDIEALVDQMTITFLDMGIKKGEKVAIWSGNSAAWFVSYLAIVKIGAIAVLVNHKYKKKELAHVLSHCDVQYVCYEEDSHENKMEAIIWDISEKSQGLIKATIPIGEKAINALDECPDISAHDVARIEKAVQLVKPEDVSSILFTSGTTNQPKGVVLSHYQLMNVARETVNAMHWTSSAQICMPLPLFHCFGLMTGIFVPLVCGGTVHFSDSYHSVDVMACIEKNKCNVLNGVPSMFLAILQNQHRKTYDLTTLDSGIIAGSGVYKNDFLEITKELGMGHLMQSFGQTEASPSITFSGYEDPLELRSISAGRKIDHMDLRIVNPTTQEVNNAFEEGEIEISGYNVMQGYYKNEAETKKVLREDGWLRTGDLGYLDEEGNLYVLGRLKDIIIRCGENISPKEIEGAILENSGISQVKVFGIPMPVVQEEIVACIESVDSFIDEAHIRQGLKQVLADYKIPKYIVIYKQFPQLEMGKIDVNKLKQELFVRIKKEKV